MGVAPLYRTFGPPVSPTLYRTGPKTARRRKVKFTPHEGQKQLLRGRKRFNYVNCGRRFGKTSFGIFLLMHYALKGRPVAWFSPNYKDLSEIWKITKRAFEQAGLIANKNEQLKQIELTNGTVIDFWSLSDLDSGRGRKYALIIVDEVAKIRGFKEAWQQTLRPTLADYKGIAWLFSTPKGRNNDWYEVCTNLGPDAAYFEATSYMNPHLDKSEIDAARAELPEDVFAQEFLAKFVDMSEGLFFTEWDNRFVMNGKEQVKIDPTWPLYITFDFNIDPTTALLFQVYDELEGGIFFLEEHMVTGGTERLCADLQVYVDHPSLLFVTGDHSGNHGSTAAGLLPGGEYNTDYEIIKRQLKINDSQLIDTRTPNKRHILSRGLINYALKNELVWINESCSQLITDISTAVPTSNGKLLKDRKFFKNDALDAFRYGVHTQAMEGVESLRRLKELTTWSTEE
ncbi:hypothetical protein LEM8419_03570 [Neolewinella maritima]|uniref:Terminase n=1 Tax=Neolewinella maritima TaxID=1383882 RepID=A0ABN8FBG9_9BACT|nr:terminase family protein [Neolewinella maritima]CAH1002698.1 hypothetical protein LEM8419_03570 [Neolewinella maritima]